MTLLPVLLLLSASAAGASATALAPRAAGSCGNGTSAIEWGDCEPDVVAFAKGLPLQCAELLVPLDYSVPDSNATHTLEIIRVPAVVQPAQGSVLWNFGGPGAEGIVNMAKNGAMGMNVTGGSYDLVSFNPRGTSKKYLPFACFTDEERQKAGWLTTAMTGAYLDASDTQPGRSWSDAKVIADTCFERVGQYAALVGTPFVARDAMKLVDALSTGREGDDLINFYGISYGSVLGATIAAMFPDRVGRMVIDGVVNTAEYYNLPSQIESAINTDKIFKNILIDCVAAGPAKCALASQNNGTVTADQLEERTYALFERLRLRPLDIPHALTRLEYPASGTSIDYSGIKGGIFATLYNPYIFQLMTSMLDEVLRAVDAPETPGYYDNTTTPTVNLTMTAMWREALASLDFSEFTGNEALTGITCADKAPSTRAGVTSLSDISPTIEALRKTSRIAGLPGSFGTTTLPCARWRLQGANASHERYEGDWEKLKTKNPILLVNPTWDPVTPIDSARNVSAAFEGSVLLERKGYGHASVSMRSACSEATIAAFFVNGTLPAPDAACESDDLIFP